MHLKIEKHFILPKNANRVAIAVSGGIDSMCLAYLAQKYYRELNISVYGLIVDHGLRKESSQEAQWVKAFLQSKGIEAHVLTWQGSKPKSNIHHSAREARYDLLLNFCQANQIPYLLTAHNLNDQAETVMLRIFRGSGIDGISAIPQEIKRDGITIFRPLLPFSRGDIENIVNDSGWEHVNDPSNSDMRYARTQVRDILNQLPEKNIWLARLSLLAENATRVRKFLERETEQALQASVEFNKWGFATVNPDKLLSYDEEIILRVLSAILKKISGNLYPPRFKSLKRLLQAIIKNDGSLTTLWGCLIKKKNGSIIFMREQAAIEPTEVINGEIVWDNRFKINYEGSGYVGAITLNAWLKIKDNVTAKLEFPFKKILYTLPAIYDARGELIIAPFYHNQNNIISLI